MGVLESTSQSFYSGVQRGKKEEYIYLTASDLILKQDYFTDATAHYWIQADTIQLAGSLSLPGRNLTINARVITSDGDLSISTSGKPVPADKDFSREPKADSGIQAIVSGDRGGDGMDGQSGGNGMSGGHIVLAAERFILKGELRLSANGSNGGRGQDGGDGMDGRKGDDGRNGETHIIWPNEHATKGSDGGSGGNGGDAGKSGNGGDAGHIFIGYVVPSDEHRITLETQAGIAGAPTLPGKAGAGTSGGIGGLQLEVVSVGSRSTVTKRSMTKRAASGKDGIDGKVGLSATIAVDGNPAHSTIVQISYEQFYGTKILNSELYKNFTPIDLESALSASLERQTLTLHKAGLAYLSGSVEQLEDAADLLTWIQQTTPDETWFDEITDQSTISRFQSDMLDASIQWIALRNKAIILISQLGQGIDYFGHPWNWVPLMPLDKYQNLGINLINAAQQAETLYHNYVIAENDQRGRLKVLNDAICVQVNRINDVKEQWQSSINERERLKLEADKLYEGILSKERSLQKVAEEFVEALRSKLAMDTLKATFDLIVNGVALVTNVTPALTALKTGGAIASAVSNYWNTGKTIVIDDKYKNKKTAANEKKKKEEELSKSIKNVTTVASSGLAIIKDGIEIYNLIDQMKVARDSFGCSSSMLAMSREQFEEMLRPVYDQMPKDKVEGYRKAFTQYLDVVEEYQRKKQSVIARHLEEAKLLAEMEQRRADQERIKQAMGNDMDAGLPLFHTYIFDLYNSLKLALTDFLYQEYQAYRYMVLSQELFPFVQDRHVAELSRIHADMTVKLKNALNGSENPVQPFKNVTFIFNEDSFPEQFETLREHGTAFFPLTLENKLIREKIAGKAHMMVSDCHIHLPGARHTAGSIHIEYTHSGHSTFLDPYGKRYDFIHNKSHGFYEYDVTLEQNTAVNIELKEKIANESGGAVGDGSSRIMPGLLSVWSIEVPLEDRNGYTLNEGVDLSQVNKIIMTLQGKAEAYAANAPVKKFTSLATKRSISETFADHEMFSLPDNGTDVVQTDTIVIEL
ncbi:hypothetical protein [Paenibacillus pini]|uniref:Uncharacterized protein n=1 Tax=Paenibacillus pini JCM 16418 TaxID=1236976 RepID=W7Z507_9BACL|nr:hypothetical protein [Paenibacillus pini]GAF09419.1 hypothetical protein JCM16418_3559 [Paenibacillus pini JCM 16418]